MTVGIVGAGQLGRMLALAGYPLGLDSCASIRRAMRPPAR
jgi:phosphoribosylaminoimidazole carboxylase (NCAIR synthetase)